MTQNQDIYSLDKAIWTENDYEQMDWFECQIYGVSFIPNVITLATDLAFDIDYIFARRQPASPRQCTSFWISPCTLIFKSAFDVNINIHADGDPIQRLQIEDLCFIDKIEQEKNKWLYEWDVNHLKGSITFKSFGFDQIARQQPILTDTLFLSIEDRNGVNFNTTPFMA